MYRDMALIRKLLGYAESRVKGDPILPPAFDGYGPEQIHYHVGLCKEAGYLHAQKTSCAGESYDLYEMRHLTWEGHEALDRLRKG